MNIPLQRLRELLPFSFLPPGNDFGQARGDVSPGDVIAHISYELLPQIARQRGLLQRFRRLEAACQEAEPALAELEEQIGKAPLPLSASVNKAAMQADNLIKRLAQGYNSISRRIVERHAADPAPLLYRAAHRAMTLIARRQLLAYRACMSPSGSSWRQLHTLYQMTCDPGLTALNTNTAPIEHEYLGALLLAYLDPGRQPRAEIESVWRCAQQLAAYVMVSEATAEALRDSVAADSCFFLVHPDEGSSGLPLPRLTPDRPLANGLIVDCSQVLAAIDRNITRQPGRSALPDLEASPALLQSLRAALGGRNIRRFNRTRFYPRADLFGGLDQVTRLLAEGSARSRRAIDGHSPHEDYPLTSSEWSLINESPDGFLIRYIHGGQCRFGPGHIVALRPRESSRLHICLVRRIATERKRLELALQILSPQVSVVALPGDGSRAIFLHNLPTYGPHAGLIAAPGTLDGVQRLSLKLVGNSIEWQVGKTLESNEELELVALELPPR